MDKRAGVVICAHFLCFSTDLSEIFSISFFCAGGLNSAFRSDLTLLHSLHFALFFQLHTKNQLSTLKNKKVGKTEQNVHCALV
jgi:hypothetical protein